MTFGSLFTGIGGMDLGLERAGMQCRWQVEIDDYASRVLAKHLPDVPRHDDVKTFYPGSWADVDVIAGGFPCQDVSQVNQVQKGLSGERSGLWHEFARIIANLQPRWVIIENVAGLLRNGIGDVLEDLARMRFNAQWATFPAAALGAPHQRQRLWIIAHANRERLERIVQARAKAGNTGRIHRDDASVVALRVLRRISLHHLRGSRLELSMPPGRGMAVRSIRRGSAWTAESPVCRVDARISNRMDRLKGLGNAVVPQVAEWIGREILAYDAR